MRFVAAFLKKFFLTVWTLLLIGAGTGAIMGWFFYQYITQQVLPSEEVQMNLETMPVNLSSTLYYKNPDTGKYVEWVTLQNTENREWVDFNDIPVNFRNAFVAIEDERFWTHPGIDIKRTVAAGLNFMTGKSVFGGSTITQQLIKNLSGDNQVTINRKITEICRAIKLEEKYSKSQILEWYMNIIYFGRGQYGIGAAADYYFGKQVQDLTLAEMCSITGITNNPSRYDPYIYPESNAKRKNIILDKMLELGYINETQCVAAKAETLTFQEHSKQQNAGAVIYPYYVDTVIEDVIQYFRDNAGVSKEQATTMLFYGGYKIYTCVDMNIQCKMDSIYQNTENIPKTKDPKSLQSSMTIIEPQSGDIVGIEGAVGKKLVSRGLNWASSRLGRRPPGSSIKPIAVYGPAMDAGIITPYSKFVDAESIKLSRTNWLPQNDNRKYAGIVSIHDAVVRSINTISAQVLDKLSPEQSYQFLTEQLHMGLDPSDMDYAPLAVGQLSIGTTTREMASAYTIFPNMGVYKQGRTFSHIEDHEGNLVYENEPIAGVAITDRTAYWMTKIMQDAVSYGTGNGAKLKDMPAAGKTGTTSDAKDRWFAGFTPYYVGVVWTGYEQPSQIHVSGNPASNIWKQVMTLIHEDLPAKEFVTPMNIEFEIQESQVHQKVQLPEGMTPAQIDPELVDPSEFEDENPQNEEDGGIIYDDETGQIIVIQPEEFQNQDTGYQQPGYIMTPQEKWWQQVWEEQLEQAQQQQQAAEQPPVVVEPPESTWVPPTAPAIAPPPNTQPIDPWTMLPQ